MDTEKRTLSVEETAEILQTKPHKLNIREETVSMEITIKIEGLDQLTESLALIGAALAYKNDMAPTATEEEPETVNEDPKTEEKEESKDQETTEEKTKPSVTREEVRAALVAKNSPSTRDKLKAIMDKYNAPNITSLDEEHFEKVLKELEAL